MSGPGETVDWNLGVPEVVAEEVSDAVDALDVEDRPFDELPGDDTFRIPDPAVPR